MEIFVDTANIEEIMQHIRMGVVSGVTTNPALLAGQYRQGEVHLLYQAVVERFYQELLRSFLFLENFRAKDFPILSLEIMGKGYDDDVSFIEGQVMDLIRVIHRSYLQLRSEFEHDLRSLALLDSIVRERFPLIKIPLTSQALSVCSMMQRDSVKLEAPKRELEVFPQFNVTLCFSVAQALMAAKAGAAYVSVFMGRLDDQGLDGIQVLEDVLSVYRAYGLKTKVLAASVRHTNHVLRAAKAGVETMTLPSKILEQLYHHDLTRKGLQSFYSAWA